MTSLGFGDEGSPPRARGAHPPGEDHCGVYRITPACAGSTCERGRARSHPSDHPRLRGEHFASASFGSSTTGSPPPARGAQIVGAVGPVARRITPACAGSTCRQSVRTLPDRDHPRLRGEHPYLSCCPIGPAGSPPPARGAHTLTFCDGSKDRITPACAGSTRLVALEPPVRQDHPRLRGEHSPAALVQMSVTGSPPPARGALSVGEARHRIVGITPACAGSTPSWACGIARSADHPRLRGEHMGELDDLGVCCGSPPPARGARAPYAVPPSTVRITPACAGSTRHWSAAALNGGDHPRLRGEHSPLR